MVLDGSTADVILGRPWMLQHFPSICWNSGEILQWSDSCFENCLQPVKKLSVKQPFTRKTTPSKTIDVNSTTNERPETSNHQEIPLEYRVFQDVFSKQLATKLPPQRPWDCAIDLLPGPLFIPEKKAIEEYIEAALKQEFICQSTFPAILIYFFVGKKRTEACGHALITALSTHRP